MFTWIKTLGWGEPALQVGKTGTLGIQGTEQQELNYDPRLSITVTNTWDDQLIKTDDLPWLTFGGFQ